MMADAVVFVGPSLTLSDARAELDAIYLGPAGQGDVYRAAREGPRAIALIDGFFERVPAVWHKEILWALAHGVAVFGGASMGALRAAELAGFGMQGVGEIYEAFRSGALEDDDEVAVAHGDRAASYRPTSEAMVNVRATLRHAEASLVIDAPARAELETIAKRIFYPDRSYPLLLARAREAGLRASVLDALARFVSAERVDQKRADARAVLGAVRAFLASSAPAKPVSFVFAHTEAWDRVVSAAEGEPPVGAAFEGELAELLPAEARAAGSAGRVALERALNRTLGSALARRSSSAPGAEALDALDGRVRAAIQAEGGVDFEVWLERNHLSPAGYRRYLQRQAELEWMQARFGSERTQTLADELRANGEYERFAARARDKQTRLSDRGLEEPSLADAGLEREELWRWYCEERLGRAVPRDRREFLLELGLSSAAFEREALRELVYSRLCEEPRRE
jgi:hypothetical protein